MMENLSRLLRIPGLVAAFWVLCTCLHCNSVSLAADGSPDDLQELRDISSFGAISVSVHSTNPGGTLRAGLAPAELTHYLQQQIASYLPEVPYLGRDTDGASQSDNARSIGRLTCRVWVHDSDAPAVFQVKCQISSAARFNIVEDGSFGYGPTDKASEIVLGQLDHILRGFAALFARAKEG